MVWPHLLPGVHPARPCYIAKQSSVVHIERSVLKGLQHLSAPMSRILPVCGCAARKRRLYDRVCSRMLNAFVRRWPGGNLAKSTISRVSKRRADQYIRGDVFRPIFVIPISESSTTLAYNLSTHRPTYTSSPTCTSPRLQLSRLSPSPLRVLARTVSIFHNFARYGVAGLIHTEHFQLYRAKMPRPPPPSQRPAPR